LLSTRSARYSFGEFRLSGISTYVAFETK